jgi:hypothetical protein
MYPYHSNKILKINKPMTIAIMVPINPIKPPFSTSIIQYPTNTIFPPSPKHVNINLLFLSKKLFLFQPIIIWLLGIGTGIVKSIGLGKSIGKSKSSSKGTRS